MDGTSLSEVLCATLAAFAGFEVALGVNYLLLKGLLRAMNFGLQPAESVTGRRENRSAL